MLVNLTEIFTTEDKVIQLTVPLQKTSFLYQEQIYPVTESEPASVILKNNGDGKAVVEGMIRIVLSIPCDRCLKEVEMPLAVSFVRELVQADVSEREQEFLDGFQLNIEDLLDSEILINWPMKVLCREDCRGICKICGRDLNTGECGCDDFVPDPRMAVIKDIFRTDKEV